MSVSRRIVTVLFADVADSTPLAEQLDPEPLRHVMSRYFDRSREVLERYGGTVEKFIGDAVMAVFGVPELHEDDAVRAVRAALELREALAKLNRELEQELGVQLAVRVGVNTGEVVAGDPSDGGTLVTGDAVNVAKRLEQGAASGEILVGPATQRLVRSAALLEPIEPLAAKGKAERVSAWRLLAAIPGVPAISRRLDIPLVGRDHELERLRNAYDRAVAERECALFTLLGPAGIGKSRLACELFDKLAEEATVLVGGCLAYGEGITFWPLNEVLRELGGEPALAKLLADDDAADLVLARVAAIAGRAPAASTRETFWAVRRLFESLARRRPLVLCFEDVHWAEPTFLDLIEYLAGWVREAPILLLCLARPEFLDDRPRFVGGGAEAESLVLRPLADGDAIEMLKALGAESERARIVEAAEGNPLYVEQLAAALAEGRPEAIPPTLHALLAARLDRLSTGERRTIEHAAVAGRDFWQDAVAELTATEERTEVGRHLLALVRKDLIRPARSTERPDDAFRFGHALIRDAAYAAIPKERRALLHEQFAGWVEATAGARAAELEEIVGYHLEQTYRYREQLGSLDEAARRIGERAGDALGSAGRRAFARGDMPAAVNLLARSAALLPGDHPTRLQALAELGSALMRTGDFSRADAVLTEAVEGAAAAGDKRLELRALIDREFFRTFTTPGDSTDEIVRVAEAAIPLLEELGDELGLAKAWWLRSEAEVNAGRWAARASALERALAHSRRTADRHDEPTLTALLAQALAYGPTPVPEAIRRCEQLRLEAGGAASTATDAEADRIDGRWLNRDRGVEAAIATTLAELRAMEGDFDEARALCARAQGLYDELGLRFMHATRCLSPAAVELLSGDPGAAAEELRRGYQALEAMGERGVRSTVAAFLAHALVADGRYEEGEAFSEISEQDAAAADVVTQVVWRGARARALARRGDLTAAERLAREGVALARSTDFLDLQAGSLLSLADVMCIRGQAQPAAELVEAARETYERKGNLVAARNAAVLVAEIHATAADAQAR